MGLVRISFAIELTLTSASSSSDDDVALSLLSSYTDIQKEALISFALKIPLLKMHSVPTRCRSLDDDGGNDGNDGTSDDNEHVVETVCVGNETLRSAARRLEASCHSPRCVVYRRKRERSRWWPWLCSWLDVASGWLMKLAATRSLCSSYFQLSPVT